jgi:hypothetical protein
LLLQEMDDLRHKKRHRMKQKLPEQKALLELQQEPKPQPHHLP